MNEHDKKAEMALGLLKTPAYQEIAVRKLTNSAISVFVKLPEGENKEQLRTDLINALRDA